MTVRYRCPPQRRCSKGSKRGRVSCTLLWRVSCGRKKKKGCWRWLGNEVGGTQTPLVVHNYITITKHKIKKKGFPEPISHLLIIKSASLFRLHASSFSTHGKCPLPSQLKPRRRHSARFTHGYPHAGVTIPWLSRLRCDLYMGDPIDRDPRDLRCSALPHVEPSRTIRWTPNF